MSELLLLVDGVRYGGWLEVRVRRSLEQGCDVFELGLTDRWEADSAPRPIAAGAPCQVLLDGEPVITGHVDDVAPSYDGARHGVSVVGRSKLADLVDCALPGERRQFAGQTLQQIAVALAQPFGVDVRLAVPDTGDAFRSVAYEPGQTVWEFLEELARIRALRLLSAPDGAMLIARAGGRRLTTPITLGENVMSAAGTFTYRDRHSVYVVQGQQGGWDENFGEASAALFGQATDARVTRYRPTVKLAEGPVTTADCQRRAEWQRNAAWGRSQVIAYTVPNWSHAEGVWAPNELVRIRDSYLGIDDWLLITSVQLVLDDKGVRTELQVMPPEAFALVPLPEPDPDNAGTEWVEYMPAAAGAAP
jgi:prophage tail gpP-like protein